MIEKIGRAYCISIGPKEEMMTLLREIRLPMRASVLFHLTITSTEKSMYKIIKTIVFMSIKLSKCGAFYCLIDSKRLLSYRVWSGKATDYIVVFMCKKS